MPFFSSAMPFFTAPCLFSESTFCALHFGKKFVKIGQKIRKLQDFLLEVCRNKFGKIHDHDFHTVVDCFNPLFIVTLMTPIELLIRKGVKNVLPGNISVPVN